MSQLRKRLIVFSIGLLLCLLILEFSLRVVGVYYVSRSETDKTVDPDAQVVVLSIGDSVTFGIGAPQGMSYPEQLERLLNDAGDGRKYIVINRGRPAQNSAQLLTRLENQLKQFKPDIVTILIGAQNQANYFGFQEYLSKQKKKEENAFYRIHNIFDHIRIYKFVRLMLRHNVETAGRITEEKIVEPVAAEPAVTPAEMAPISAGQPSPDQLPENWQNMTPEELADFPGTNGPAAPNMYPDPSKNNTPECVAAVAMKMNGEYDKALESILSVIDKQEVESECYNVAGGIYTDKEEYDNAIEMFKKGIERDPGQFRNYEGIGDCYRGKGDVAAAIDWYEKGFAAARYDSLYELCYVGISDSYKITEQYQRGTTFFSKEMKREPVSDDYLHALAADYYAMFKMYGEDEDVHDWIAADIEDILALCARYNAKPVLQNYPTEKPIAELYKRVAQKNMIPFVDQNKSFRPYTKDGILDKGFFVPDGHPNEKGYHIMAENIFKVLKRNVLEH